MSLHRDRQSFVAQQHSKNITIVQHQIDHLSNHWKTDGVNRTAQRRKVFCFLIKPVNRSESNEAVESFAAAPRLHLGESTAVAGSHRELR
jgi:hypothetical protein